MLVLPEIKKDLEFNRSLRSLVEVLKSIAVTHYHILERKIKTDEGFFAVLQEFFSFPQLKAARHPLLYQSDRPVAIVGITSDMGLLGGLNMKVMEDVLEDYEKYKARLIIIGEKGHGLARDRKLSFIAFPGVKDEERYGQAVALRDFLTEQVATGKIGAVEVIHPEPVTFLVQRVKKVVLLPFTIPEPSPELAVQGPAVLSAILESSLDSIVEYLISLWMGQMFYQILGYSRLAELAARFIHLENSSQKLQDLEKQLRLKYFRVRHEIIDKSMREIFSARSLYVSNGA